MMPSYEGMQGYLAVNITSLGLKIRRFDSGICDQVRPIQYGKTGVLVAEDEVVKDWGTHNDLGYVCTVSVQVD